MISLDGWPPWLSRQVTDLMPSSSGLFFCFSAFAQGLKNSYFEFSKLAARAMTLAYSAFVARKFGVSRVACSCAEFSCCLIPAVIGLSDRYCGHCGSARSRSSASFNCCVRVGTPAACSDFAIASARACALYAATDIWTDWTRERRFSGAVSFEAESISCITEDALPPVTEAPLLLIGIGR